MRGMLAATIGRSLRALFIIGAAWVLVLAFGLDVDELAARDTLWTRLVRGAVHALAIVLIADVIWQVSASLIDQKLGAGGDTSATVHRGPAGTSSSIASRWATASSASPRRNRNVGVAAR